MEEPENLSYYCGLVDKLEAEHNLSDEEFSAVLLYDDPDFDRYIAEKARAVRERIYGKTEIRISIGWKKNRGSP